MNDRLPRGSETRLVPRDAGPEALVRRS